MHAILPPKCLWASNTFLLRAFTAPSVSTLPRRRNLRDHICIAPAPEHEKTKKPPNKQNQTLKTSHKDARNLNPDPSGSKPSSLVKSAQFDTVYSVVALSSLSLYKELKCSLDEGWSVHSRSVLSGHDLAPGWESMVFFSLAKGAFKNSVQSSAFDTESLGGLLV